ncbi:MAG: hypothetical protein U9Q84_00460 [Thermodesulfobacteriota bacterium]|nr:hypothetical protein [Thermodesulfobacteriota bacterium]
MATEWLERKLNKEKAKVYFSTLVNFFIKSLKKIHNLGFNAEAITEGLNGHGVGNPFYAKISLWNANDVSQLLSASESDLVFIN